MDNGGGSGYLCLTLSLCVYGVRFHVVTKAKLACVVVCVCVCVCVCDVVCESERVSHQKKEDSGRTLGMVTGRGSVCGCTFSVVTEGSVR